MMTEHQHHHIVENECGFYCQTCVDQAAIEAQLRNELTLARTDAESVFKNIQSDLRNVYSELEQARAVIARKDRFIELLQAQIAALKALEVFGRLFQIADELDAQDKAGTP
jgi:hypothetical protein